MSFEEFAKEVAEATTLQQLDSIAARETASDRLTIISFRRQTVERDAIIEKRDAQLSEKHAQLVEKHAQLVEKHAQLVEKHAIIEKTSLFAALSYGEKLKEWKYMGKPGKSTHLPAESVDEELNLKVIDESMEIVRTEGGEEETFGAQLRAAPLNFVVDSVHNVLGFNEADVQGNVHRILEDAVGIVNIMIGLASKRDCVDDDKPRCLYVCREANMLSNRPDHSAVYLDGRKVPIATIEDKPDSAALDNARVHGQKFDQFLETVLLCHDANAVGAVTSVTKTRLTWIGVEADKLLKSTDLLSVKSLKSCQQQLTKNRQTTGTPDAKKTRISPEISESTLSFATSNRNGDFSRAAKKARREPQRKLNMSQSFDAEQIIVAFCNLIVAGIRLNKGHVENYLLSPGQNINLPACVALTTGNKAPKIQPLEVKIRGHAERPKLPRLFRTTTYYMVGRMEFGLMYNTFRAVTSKGYECVVKMYVCEYDPNAWGKILTFDEDGRKAVEDEESMYHRAYPELKDYVWTEKLCGRYCLIVPFFAEISERERDSYGSVVATRYDNAFVKQGHAVEKHRIMWRHIGVFNNMVYFFSLSNVVKRTETNAVQDGTTFLHILTARRPASNKTVVTVEGSTTSN